MDSTSYIFYTLQAEARPAVLPLDWERRRDLGTQTICYELEVGCEFEASMELSFLELTGVGIFDGNGGGDE